MEPSLHQSLPPELQVMSFQLRLLKLIGLVGPRGRIHRFYLAFGWATFVILFPKSVLGFGSTRFDAICKGLAELLFEGNLFIAIATLVLKLPAFKRMIQLLSDFIRRVTLDDDQSKDCFDLIREQNSKINRFTKFYFIYCCFGPLVFCIPALGTSYVRYFSTNSTNFNATIDGNELEQLEFQLPMEQAFYGLNIRTNFAHYHLFVVLSLLAYCVCSYMSVIKVTTLLIMIKYSSLTYRLVAIRVRKLAQFTTPQQQDVKVASIETIVQLHKKAFRITDLLEDILNVPVAMQFLACILFWCLTMFYVSTNINFNLFNVMVLFWLSLIETYGFAYLGSELTAEAQAVGQAVYELAWYEDSVELQRHYRLIIQRSQRETGITAANFIVVGVEKFGKVVQMSYSYYLVLKDVLDRL